MHETLQARWTEIGDKLVELAKDFPEDRYDAAPSSGTRTFAEQLRHVAFWNDYAARRLQQQDADGSANEVPRSAAPTKAKVVDVLRRSFDDVGKEIRHMNGSTAAADVDTVISFIEHNGEHYGQLVLYFRLAGLVPPSSR
ncbi:MAG: DinB family protein [Gemmatimonadaceae bacterium]|nr:DinB family protein [Gemmatimonadaceae bacterium]